MNDKAVCRTAPATPGLLNIKFSTLYTGHYFLSYERIKLFCAMLPLREALKKFKTDGRTDGHCMQLLDQIGPKGQVGINLK